MERDPHQLIEGVLIASYAIGAAQAFLYVRGEMALAQERIAQALNDAYAAGYIGKNILGSDFSVDVVLHWGAGAYIVGEETALIERSEEHTSELQSLMRISYAVFCLKKKKKNKATARHMKRQHK